MFRRLASTTALQVPGALRPHLKIEVNPNHGLYKFFRRYEDGDYLSVETATKRVVESGRSWHTAELKRKSFKDLHTLWYVVLRERNLLATQREEARRLGLSAMDFLHEKDSKCKRTMTRIKGVLNERRIALEQALAAEAKATGDEPTPENVKE